MLCMSRSGPYLCIQEHVVFYNAVPRYERLTLGLWRMPQFCACSSLEVFNTEVTLPTLPASSAQIPTRRAAQLHVLPGSQILVLGWKPILG